MSGRGEAVQKCGGDVELHELGHIRPAIQYKIDAGKLKDFRESWQVFERSPKGDVADPGMGRASMW